VTLNRKQKTNTLNESHDYVSKAKDRYNSNRNNINDNQENIRKKSSENEYANNDEFKN
jgi:hypothetical protein